MEYRITTDQEMKQLGADLAQKLPVGFCMELVGDVGAGKTTLVKGLVGQLNSEIDVTSPSFVINNRYQINSDYLISHFDFYRLAEIGIDDQQLAEDLVDSFTSVVIEWGDTVQKVLPVNRLTVKISYLDDGNRLVHIKGLEDDISS